MWFPWFSQKLPSRLKGGSQDESNCCGRKMISIWCRTFRHTHAKIHPRNDIMDHLCSCYKSFDRVIMTSQESYMIVSLSLSCTLFLLLHQLTESATHSPSTSALQVPRFSVDQRQKSLATKSNKRQTMKANGMKWTIVFSWSNFPSQW